MIREVCSCGAEFESDLPNQVELVKNWRRTHKHADKPHKPDTADLSITSDNQVALGFQAIYDQFNDDND
jgi:hypothetical protein